MWKLDGNIILQDQPFWHNGVQYPANWITMSSQADKDAIGLVWMPVQPCPYDDRYYWVTLNEDGTWTAVPKDLNQLKLGRAEEVKAGGLAQLAITDWQSISMAENPGTLPPVIAQWRDDIRTVANDYMAEIMACTTVEQLIALDPVEWPEDPRVPTATPYI